LDDLALQKIIPLQRLAQRTARAAIPIVVAVFILFCSIFLEFGRFVFRGQIPAFARVILAVERPWGIVNAYGLFAVMTTHRYEIILEGSADGQNWQSYEFKWKPGDLNTAPKWAQPHQPRLDWQMWFAALETYRENPWLLELMAKLLENDPVALRLLKTNPFPATPPHYIRARLYEYAFTDAKTRAITSAWWERTFLSEYTPVLSLNRP
jgi:hypothetical protein